MPSSRRGVLAALAGALAGCATGPDRRSVTTTDPAGPTTAADGTPTEDTTREAGATATPRLDLREANVVGVAVDGSYRFEVTLYHDDDGEDGYANWWQVEGLDGTRLGRRELAHPHGTRRFTRSTTVDVPAGVSCVVVRGHDQTHGYGGQAMLVDLETGATRGVAQGPDPESFEAADCP